MKTLPITEEFPGRTAHGDAWRYFLKEMHGKSYGPDEMIHVWEWFLAGWRAKGKQRVDIRS
jgi:hypothetical protein